MRLDPGTRLGPYEVLASLGEGGMGEVYRAKDSRLGREVAVKVLPAEVAEDPERLRRFEQEARAASALQHPNLLTVHDVGDEDGIVYLVTELLRGEPLRERIGRGALPAAEALAIASQVARGLAAAHEKGIVHRDLKPDNVFLTRDGHAKILDFGLARIDPLLGGELAEADTIANRTGSGVLLGTVGYMAPEQARGERADARSDLFAFGCLLYEMLAGSGPFRRASPLESLHAILNDEPPPLAGVPASLERIVRHCLEKDPARRFQSAGELRDALDQASQGGSVASFPAVAAPVPPGRRRALGVAIALAVLVAAALLFDLGGLRHRLAGGGGAAIDSLAVLPLVNYSNDPSQEFFADGMTEALIAELAKIRALKVISRTSVMQYKNASRPLPAIARELGVRGVVEGSVVRDGGTVRITVQLIDAEQDRHVWAESYTRDEKDVLRLQGEVAAAIAREIRVAVRPDEARALASARVVDPEAHLLLLQARELTRRGATQQVEQERVNELVDRAIALAPDYAAAHVFRGSRINSVAVTGYEAATRTCPPARAELATALSLDPSSIEAHALDADLRAMCDYDWAGALNAYRKALVAAPGRAELHDGYAGLLALVGRRDEAIEHARRALELDPLNDWLTGREVWILVLAHRFDEAVAAGFRARELSPDSVFLKWEHGNAQLAAGDRPGALATYLSRQVGRPEMNFMVGLTYGLDGQPEKAREVLDFLLERRSQRYVPATMIGLLHGVLGDRDAAFEWLERAYDEHDYFLHPVAFDPAFDLLRDDPRLRALITKLNLPAGFA